MRVHKLLEVDRPQSDPVGQLLLLVHQLLKKDLGSAVKDYEC
jgi:hypothetical protein